MPSAVKHLLEFGPFRLDPDQRLLLRDHEPIPLSPKAFDLLVVLAKRSGEVVLKDELMTLLWPDTFVEESNLGQHIFQLRKALGERAQSPAYIVTVPGRGYRFAQKVRTIVAEPEEELVLESHSRSRVLIEEETMPDRPPASTRKSRSLSLTTTFAALMVALGAAVLLRVPLNAPKVLGARQITYAGQAEPSSRVFSDGSRLYFTERIGGNWMLAQVPSSGGEPSLITTSIPSPVVYDFNPNQSKLLVGAETGTSTNPLWVVSTQGGGGQRLGDILATDGAWSPDGRIVYSHDGDVFLAGSNGEDPRKLLTAQGRVLAPRLSPDGQLLRFSVQDLSTGRRSLWEASADGHDPHLLPLGWKTVSGRWGDGECCGAWTPDGTYFVFRSVHNGVDSFWAIREKPSWLRKRSGLAVQLYTSPDNISPPRFSMDGKRIFFVDYQERRELARYDGIQKLFVPYLGGIPARLLSFSRDGKWVAYRSDTDDTLWRSRVDGTERLQLTFAPLEVFHSSWSPDGKRIVFEGHPPGEPGKLYSVPFNGGSPELVLSDGDGVSGPSWSPDGRQILFQRWANTETGRRISAVCALDLSTHQTRILPGSEGLDGVHFSPDGKYAAAAAPKNRKLMLFDFARQRWSELADGSPYGWGIRWSSNSQYVYYQHLERGEEQPIFRVRVSDRRVEQITSARQILRADVLSYSMTGLAPDNSPLASLIHRNSDIFVLELDLP